MPLVAAGLWFAIPRETFDRLATIPSQLESGDLNQRLNIWDAGWQAFMRSPLVGSGAGSFTGAAATNFRDTAHNSELSILVGGGLAALFLAAGIVALAARAVVKTRGPLRFALATVLAVWAIAAQVDTVEENRATWLLLGLIAVAGRLAVEEPERLDECFGADHTFGRHETVHRLASRPAG
jgi:O-antigen ligase